MAGRTIAADRLTVTTPVTIYTGPVTHGLVKVHGLSLTNNSAATVNVTVEVPTTGQTTNAKFIVVDAYPLLPHDTIMINELIGLELNGTFKIILTASTANVVNYFFTGEVFQ